jgi:hypothetical protein
MESWAHKNDFAVSSIYALDNPSWGAELGDEPGSDGMCSCDRKFQRILPLGEGGVLLWDMFTKYFLC